MKRYHCPSCGADVSGFKNFSIFWLLLAGLWYVLYYYLFKESVCPACKHKLSKEEGEAVTFTEAPDENFRGV